MGQMLQLMVSSKMIMSTKVIYDCGMAVGARWGGLSIAESDVLGFSHI